MTLATSEISSIADTILLETCLLQNPYFLTLQSQTLEAVRASQEDFYFEAAYFSRPMSYLITRLDDPKMRLDILHNVVEEHGDFQEEKFHAKTFQKLLSSLGTHIPALLERKAPPHVHTFNVALTGACVSDPIEVGIAANGIIEYAFADISALLGKLLVTSGFVEKKKLVHYNLHADLDKQHAQEFFDLLEPSFHDPKKKEDVLAGLRLGAHLFNRLYLDLYEKHFKT